MSQRSLRSGALLTGVVLAASLAGYGWAAGQGAVAARQPAGNDGKIPITSSSADARAAYLKGRHLGENARVHDSREFLTQAAAQDPAFALAHYLLATNAPTAKSSSNT